MVEWKKHDLPTLAEKEAAEKKQKEREQLLETVAALPQQDHLENSQEFEK